MQLHLVLIVFALALAHSESIQLFEEPLMMLVSFDGFRWDYLKRFDLPNFNYLKHHGSHAEHIKNSFATVTFPSKQH